jgi:hypothetical protein
MVDNSMKRALFAAALCSLAGVAAPLGLAAADAATHAVVPPTAAVPSQVLDLTNWKLTLPIDAKGGTTGTAVEIKAPNFAGYQHAPWFTVNSAGDAVDFRANVEGATTSGSHYPRSELREMTNSGTAEAAWSTKGTSVNILTAQEAVLHLPSAKAQTVTAQIHNSSSDVIEILADGTHPNADGTIRLCYRFGGSTQPTHLDDHYKLGTKFALKITAGSGRISIAYNNVTKTTVKYSGSGLYFKAGDYTQSNLSKGDAAGAYGEVAIYAVAATHSG